MFLFNVLLNILLTLKHDTNNWWAFYKKVNQNNSWFKVSLGVWNANYLFSPLLTHFILLVSLYTPPENIRKHQETSGFLIFSRGIEREQ